ncbi:MAG TPA: serine protease [Actinophytocola sp.]|uniref:S1 family peptidase n=1 Tax=Actinophytocola sp. TaxID=1872138 RepID=UPI002DDD43DC|nr:serine protease [Actinophytocola sp.]HEV2782696.1 serine protease [Actinophytocola sp.]
MGETRRTARSLLAASLAVVLAFAVQAGGARADERIVGGSRVSTAQYPYMVYLAKPDGFQFCGGTLVGSHKVVTAAHCVVGLTPAALRVVAGRDDKTRDDTGVVVRVTQLWVHPAYVDVRSGADIAVLTLARRLRFRPAAVATGPELYRPGTPSTVLGWGRTSEGGPTSDHLLGATVPVVADADCARAYRDFAADAMVCAGYVHGGVDTCQGDSGGPMIIRGALVGIASWGDGCARPGKFGVYTRVASYAQVLAEHL